MKRVPLLIFFILPAAGFCLAAPARAAEISVTQSRSPRFPLSIHDDGARAYFVDQDRIPFLFACDIAQAMLNRLRIEDVRHYLNVRAKQGYNSFWFIVGTPKGWTDDLAHARPGPKNAYGVLPFDNTRGDLSNPNDAYFRHVRAIVDEAARRGMLVGIAPDYVGYSGDDMLPLMKQAGPAGCRDYGRFVGEFFRDRPNLFWIHHGDNNPYNFGGADSSALVDAFVAGLKEADNLHPRFHTAISRVTATPGLPASKTRSSSYRAQLDPAGQIVNPLPWLNLNHVYAKNRGQYATMLADFLEAWNVARDGSPKLPYITIDGVCTHYHDDARANRAQGYYAMLSGAAGFFSGNIRICWFMSPETPPVAKRNWKDELSSPAEITATHTARFFRALPWWQLVPDTSRRLFRHHDSTCAAARTTDGRMAVLYMPSRRALMVDLAAMPGRSIAIRWFNPRTGEYLSGGIYAPSLRELIPPGETDDATEDWAVLLEAERPSSGASAR